MPEPIKAAADEDKFPTGEGEDKSSDEKKDDDDSESSSGDDSDEAGDDKEGKGDDAGKKEEAADDGEPVVRRSAKDFIIARKDKKIEKIKSESDAGERSEEGDSSSDDSDDEELTPAAKKAIQKQTDESNRPIINALRSQSDERELNDVYAKYPNLKELDKDIRKYMNHPAYKDTSVELLALGLAAKKGKLADTTGKKKEADDEAAGAKSGGSSRRKKESQDSKIPNVNEMSDKEFDDLVFKVKTGRN